MMLNGYMHVRLSRNGKQRLYKVHVLVGMAFLGYSTSQYNRKDINSLVIDHINGIKSDNRVENLRIVTQRKNLDLYYKNRRKK